MNDASDRVGSKSALGKQASKGGGLSLAGQKYTGRYLRSCDHEVDGLWNGTVLSLRSEKFHKPRLYILFYE